MDSGKRSSQTNEQEASLNKKAIELIVKDTRSRVAHGCINPQVITAGSPISKVFDGIDECIWSIQKEKSHLFNYLGDTEPRVFINALRGYYYYCFLYYMWKCKCLDNDYDLPTFVGSTKIPISLAKYFQHFAPYVDGATGTVFKQSFVVTNPKLFLNWPSVDQRALNGINVTDSYTSPSQHLNSPNSRYLLAAVPSTTDYSEYCAVPGVQAKPGVSVTEGFFSDYIQTNAFRNMLKVIQNLTPGAIVVSEIPRFAPDGSAYAIWSMAGVYAPLPAFTSEMGVMLGFYSRDDGTSVDWDLHFLYSKGLPVVRNPAYGEQEASWEVRRLTLIQVYFTTLYYANYWSDGSFYDLYADCGIFTGLTKLQYTRSEIEVDRICRSFLNALETADWTELGAEEGNGMFAFIQMCWSEFFQRNFPWFGIPHCDKTIYRGVSPYNSSLKLFNSPCFFDANTLVTSARFPPPVARLLSAIGPILVDGAPRFPYLNHQSCLNSTMYFKTTQPIFGFSEAVKSNGVWDVTQSEYSVNCDQKVAINLKVPGTGTSFYVSPKTISVGSNDFAIVYTVNMSKLQSVWGTYFSNKYPITLGPDRWVNTDKTSLGYISPMTSRTIIAKLQTTSSYPAYENKYFKKIAAIGMVASSQMVCVSAGEAMESSIFGFTPFKTLSDEPDSPRPLYLEFGPQFYDPLIRVMLDSNSSGNSQFQQYLRADLQRDRSPLEAANKLITMSTEAYQDDVIGDSKPAYDSILENAGLVYKAVSENPVVRDLSQQAQTALRAYSVVYVGRYMRQAVTSGIVWYLNFRNRHNIFADEYGLNNNINY